MSRPSISTPCPAPSRLSLHQINALPSFAEQDDTSQIDYTRVIQHEFAHARPRRPGRRDVGPKVFEDVVEGEEMNRFEKSEEVGRRGMLLGKRPSRRVPMGSIGQGRSTMAPTDPLRGQVGASLARDDRSTHDSDANKKDARRRTIYVPSDDTTLMTIHPGANTTNRLDDTFQLPTYKPQSLIDCIAQSPPVPEEPKQIIPSKKPRLSLAAAPRRAPLGQIEAKSLNLPTMDMIGEGGGKENTPPLLEANEKPFAKNLAVKSRDLEKSSMAKSSLFQPTAASQSRQTIQSRKAVPITRTKPSPRAPTVVKTSKPRQTETRDAPRTTKPRSSIERRAKDSPSYTKAPLPPKPWKVSANFVSKTDASKAKLQRYPVLNEDVSRPDLYEDSWLNQQEVALTEVVNQIFTSAEPSMFEHSNDERSARELLLELYNQPDVAMLHKRLQASLTYGALSKPKDMPHAPDLTQDLGLRRRFVQLWMDSYKMDTLCAAAEVVVGRQMPMEDSGSTHGSGPNLKSIDPKQSRRSMIGFLETFFVTVDDLETNQSTSDEIQIQRRNKTVLRSLMLIWLLDQAATSVEQPKRLFKIKSAHKTSASVLNALAGMLVPSIGDVGRVMRHMEFIVSYVQDPLDEVVYHINNLAVDLRDGIMLTKLVELLLYRTPSEVWEHQSPADDTVTIVMPDFTVLESALYGEDGLQQKRILVQHLKMPCLGHAQKVYNVDIALQALASHPRTADTVAADITADSIVNGHRENTLNLLWSLVSSVGLDALLDKKALINDIARLDLSSFDLDQVPTDLLLQKWAAAYCAPNGIHISNLTTSFALDSPYSAIVASFADFFDPADARASIGSNTATRLRSMGCSEAFIKQLTSSTSSIPTRQATLANLAFLASRLLPLAKRHHAAATIQRAFRARLNRRVLGQRVALMRMATDCAKVVQSQQRFVDAAVLVQRTWRSIVSHRVARLESDVSEFQVLARGWMARRRAVGVKKDFAWRGAGW
ncbi:hypothetical protein Q7P37_007440 [Cladosporium fusiforme]